MKRFYLIAILGILSFNGYSQGFLDNSDYVYGCGPTDSAALMSLSSSIGVTIKNESTHTISEIDSNISSHFVKRTGLSSSRDIFESLQYYDADKHIYYRYINKAEYINKCLYMCEQYKTKAEYYDNSQNKHKRNLVLGYYYKAYMAINTPMFLVLTRNEYDSYRNEIKYIAENLYLTDSYGELFLDEKSFDGYWIVTNISHKTVGNPPCLFAFEYYNNGKWYLPSYYTTFDGIENNYSLPNDNNNFYKCFIHIKTNEIIYRIIYEDEHGKIEVPEDWYFFTYKVINSRFLN